MTYFHVLEREVGAIGHQDGSVDSDAVRVPLVLFGIAIPFQVGELESPAAWHEEFLFGFIVLGSQGDEDLLGAGHHFGKLLELAPNEQADGVLAIFGGVLKPITQ